MPGARRQNPQAFLCGSLGTMLFSGVPSVLVLAVGGIMLEVALAVEEDTEGVLLSQGSSETPVT